MSNDITFCTNKDCSLKETCYRFIGLKYVPDNEIVSMAKFEYKNDKCEFYKKIKEVNND